MELSLPIYSQLSLYNTDNMDYFSAIFPSITHDKYAYIYPLYSHNFPANILDIAYPNHSGWF